MVTSSRPWQRMMVRQPHASPAWVGMTMRITTIFGSLTGTVTAVTPADDTIGGWFVTVETGTPPA